MYKRISAPFERPKVKCLLCKRVVDLVRENNRRFLDQHEEAQAHKAAMSSPDGTGVACAGVKVPDDDGLTEGFLPAIRSWASAGFPWMITSPGVHASQDDQGSIWLRSEICHKEGHNLQPEKAYCVHCEKFLKNKEFKQRVCRWAVHILLVKLLHATLVDEEATRAEVLRQLGDTDCFGSVMTGWDEDVALEDLSYPDLYQLCHQRLAHLSLQACNSAAAAFLDGRFKWILRKKVSYTTGPHAEALQKYAKALAGGANCQEVQIAQHVLSGKLRSDAVLKTLVTAMVMKCTRLNHVKRKNSGSLPGVDEAELAEAGFALSACP